MMRRIGKAFTLLELLASVALLVILGTMMFEIFGKTSDIVSISNSRQEIFQYARASLEFIQREVEGAFTGVDAYVGTSGQGIKGLQVYNTKGSMGSSCTMRENSQGICTSTGVMARDTQQHIPGGGQLNPYYGQDVNVCRVGYYLNNEQTRLDCASICRLEFYDITELPSDVTTENPAGSGHWVPDSGQPFVRGCLLFTVEVMSRFGPGSGLSEWGGNNTPTFTTMDWDSDQTPNGLTYPRRRGLPQALRFTMRITDEFHAMSYKYGHNPAGGSGNIWYVPGPDITKDYWGQEDPVVQTFSEIVYFGHRSD